MEIGILLLCSILLLIAGVVFLILAIKCFYIAYKGVISYEDDIEIMLTPQDKKIQFSLGMSLGWLGIMLFAVGLIILVLNV